MLIQLFYFQIYCIRTWIRVQTSCTRQRTHARTRIHTH